jgi:hypothetical protein
MNRCTQSLGRVRYVTRRAFDNQIVRNDSVIGIALAHVSAIRRLRADIATPNGVLEVKSVCVIDLVEPGDCEGHAAMGYSEAINGMSERQLGKKRKAIRMDLANTFAEMSSPGAHQWPSRLGIIPKRFVAIAREFVGLFIRRD